MILALLHLILITAEPEKTTAKVVTESLVAPSSIVINTSSNMQTLTFNASTKSVMTIPGPAKEIQKVTETVTAKATCNPTATVTTTANPESKKKETLCVKCYDKIINTPDCKKCSMTCEDGTKIDSINSEKSNKCPNKDIKDVPCPCKDENGRVIADNYYKSNELSNKALLVEDGISLSN